MLEVLHLHRYRLRITPHNDIVILQPTCTRTYKPAEITFGNTAAVKTERYFRAWIYW